ncbi:hypothetical protein J2S10_005477 [Neobacillus ginsengisoli]|uniref:Uncharacterized protein n=1 Tax=Neobacillus ginsengisoli TaxID=904295 RepID=A0ABT9Y3M4_9BACI|nr:hypothetical protein [Neobacillus ginsengisoli]
MSQKDPLKFFQPKTADIRQFLYIFDINLLTSKYSISLPVTDYDKIFFVSFRLEEIIQVNPVKHRKSRQLVKEEQQHGGYTLYYR